MMPSSLRVHGCWGSNTAKWPISARVLLTVSTLSPDLALVSINLTPCSSASCRGEEGGRGEGRERREGGEERREGRGEEEGGGRGEEGGEGGGEGRGRGGERRREGRGWRRGQG